MQKFDFLQFEMVLKNHLINMLTVHKGNFNNVALVAFDFGMFPWFGGVEFSFLTEKELQKQPDILTDIAAWQYYFLNEGAINDDKTVIYKMNKQMQKHWEATLDSKSFFKLAVNVLKDKNVQNSFSLLNLSDDFKYSVYDADDPEFFNYYESLSITK